MISIIKKKQNKKIRNISFLNILQFFNNNGKYLSKIEGWNFINNYYIFHSYNNKYNTTFSCNRAESKHSQIVHHADRYFAESKSR